MARGEVQVVAPSRLHFGLFGFGCRVAPLYGGVGAMIEYPVTEVLIQSADALTVEGVGQRRGRSVVVAWLRGVHRTGYLSEVQRADDLPCRVSMARMPRAHVGLGSGTQLAMSITTALNRFFGISEHLTQELVRYMGRGKRSQIGLNGFVHGGLILDHGLDSPDSGNADCQHIQPPDSWRVLVVSPRAGVNGKTEESVRDTDDPSATAGRATKAANIDWAGASISGHDISGLDGGREDAAFAQAGDVDQATRDRLANIAVGEIIPAAVEGEFARFSRAVGKFNQLAGQCFAAVQGGPYRGLLVNQIVQYLHDEGCEGVGQSSWGPCVFAWIKDDERARQLTTKCRRRWGKSVEVFATRVARLGARVYMRASPV